MKNPWTKKNPLMSMWLSGANSVLGSARGHATAATKRQATSIVNQSVRSAADLWTSALLGTPAAKPKKRSKARKR